MTERAATLVLGADALLAPVGRGLASAWAFERAILERASVRTHAEMKRLEAERIAKGHPGVYPGHYTGVALHMTILIHEHWAAYMALFPEPERGRTYDGDGYYSRYDEDPQAPAR